MISKKPKKASRNLNYVENLLILASMITGCVSIPVFALLVPSLLDPSYSNYNSEVTIELCVITAGMKKVADIKYQLSQSRSN